MTSEEPDEDGIPVCHLPGCPRRCAKGHIFCAHHWRLVSPALRRKVMATSKQRGERIDATWAPWWKAQATAKAQVLRKIHGDEDREWIDNQLRAALQVAERLEKRKNDS